MTSANNPPQYRLRTMKDHLNPKWYNPRYRTRGYLREEIKRILSLPENQQGGTVLDYGCGDKPYLPLFQNNFAAYLGADLPGNPDADIIINPDNILETDSSSVDCVLSVQVLEHLESPQAYLAEAKRVLKPNGRLILSTHGMWPYHPDPNDYWRWTVEGLKLELQRAGFEVISVKGILSRLSIAIQFWQDATIGWWPRYLRQLNCGFLQACIGLVERRHKNKPLEDACIFVMYAKKA